MNLSDFRFLLISIIIILISPKCIYAQNDSRGYKIYAESVSKNKSKYGLKNAMGKIVVPAKYDWIGNVSQIVFNPNGIKYNRILVGQGGKKPKFGFVDTLGNTIIPIKYDYLDWPSSGLILAREGSNLNYLDLNGDIAVPLPKAVHARSFSEGIGFVTYPGEGVEGIDRDGNKIFKLPKDYIVHYEGFASGVVGYSFYDKTIGVRKYGFINRKGEIITEPIYDYDVTFHPKLHVALVLQKNHQGQYRYGLVDTLGNYIVPITYESRKLEIENDQIIIEEDRIKTSYSSIEELLNLKKNEHGVIVKGYFDPFQYGKEAYDKKDYLKAALYFKNQRLKENADAYYYIGLMYANGYGYEKNVVVARRWLSQAYNLGKQEALQIRDNLELTID